MCKNGKVLMRLLVGVVAIFVVAGTTEAITIHSDSGFGSDPASSTVDDDIGTYGTHSGASGWVIYDLGSVGIFDTVNITSRNHAILCYPDQWTVSVFDNDDPDIGNEVVIGNTNSRNLNNGQEQLLRVTESSKRYIKFAWSASHGSYVGFAEFHAYNSPASAKVTFTNTRCSLSWDWRSNLRTADNQLDTFSTYQNTTGWVVVDFGFVVNMDKLRIYSRDHSSHYFPKDVAAYVYDNDDPMTGSEVQIGSGQFPDLVDGNVAVLDVNDSTKRYIKFEWTSTWSVTSGANIAEISAVPVGGPANCAEAVNLGYGVETDLDDNCYITFMDMAVFATNWIRCSNPQDPNCERPWE